jgi:hypothetical protein
MILSPGPLLRFEEVSGDTRTTAAATTATEYPRTLEDVERDYILRVLEACDWSVRGPGNAAKGHHHSAARGKRPDRAETRWTATILWARGEGDALETTAHQCWRMPMTRISEVERPGLAVRAFYQIGRAIYGRVPTPERLMAHRVPLMMGLGGLYAAIEWFGRIESTLRALLNVQVAALYGSAY